MAASSPSTGVQELCKGLVLDNEVLKQFIRVFQEELKLGLEDETEKLSSIKCYSTCITELPTGSERGEYLTLELSGVEVKVTLVKLKQNSFDMRAKMYPVTEEMKKGPGNELFSYLAESLKDFCETQRIEKTTHMLGFCFGFPYKQKSLKSGILLYWTKDFHCAGVVGKDVVVLLEKAISKIEGLNVKVMSLCSSATETLLSCVWKNHLCRIGCKFEGGFNISYVEKSKHVPKLGEYESDVIMINTECGNFGEGDKLNFLRTGWDKEVDIDSSQQGKQQLDKMIGTLYLSEIVRRILVTAVQRSVMMKVKMTRVLATIDALPSKAIFDIVLESVGQRGARSAWKTLGYPTPCAQDCVDLEYVCTTVLNRAIHLVSAIFAALASHLRYKEVVVGIDGNFFYWLPNAADEIKAKVAELNPQIKFDCEIAVDRGGMGASIAATLANQQQTRKSILEDIAKEDSFFRVQNFVSVDSLAPNASRKSLAERISRTTVIETHSRGKSVNQPRKTAGDIKVLKAPMRDSNRRSTVNAPSFHSLKQISDQRYASRSNLNRSQSQINKSFLKPPRASSVSIMKLSKSRGSLPASKSQGKIGASRVTIVDGDSQSRSSIANLRKESRGLSRTSLSTFSAPSQTRRDIVSKASKMSLAQRSASTIKMNANTKKALDSSKMSVSAKIDSKRTHKSIGSSKTNLSSTNLKMSSSSTSMGSTRGSTVGENKSRESLTSGKRATVAEGKGKKSAGQKSEGGAKKKDPKP